MLKQISKYIGVIVIAILILYLSYAVVLGAKYYLDKWEMARKVDQFNQMVINMFKSDTYGGETPEETYNLFVDALKKQDVDLAVKYFILDAERQDRYHDYFNEMKENGKLQGYGEKLPEWSEWEQIKDNYNDWEEQAMIRYGQVVNEPITIYDSDLNQETIISPGVWSRTIIFTKNINIWKISSL